MWVVVPVKRFSNAKSRLAPLLSAAERESLAQAMLHDVLAALAGSRRVAGILVVSHEVRARYAVERVGGLFVEENGTGLSSAIGQAAQWLATHGQRGMLMVPGDVPLIDPRDVDQLIASHGGGPAVTVVPDREHDGTNGLAVSPADVIDFHFGRGSFMLHRDAALGAGLEPGVLELASFALDVDNPLDLNALLTHDSATESFAYLCDSGIARRLLPRHNGARLASEIAGASRLI